VRLLVDQNLPPRLCSLLTDAGHDAVHVRDLGLASAPDAEILDLAADQGRTIISADTDFGALLAQRRSTRPSVLLVRAIVDLSPDAMAERLVAQLPALASDLSEGAIVALTPRGARSRRLPLR
jgi:predicted nuclease of predicted toxin-antitoxin system